MVEFAKHAVLVIKMHKNDNKVNRDNRFTNIQFLLNL